MVGFGVEVCAFCGAFFVWDFGVGFRVFFAVAVSPLPCSLAVCGGCFVAIVVVFVVAV